MNWPYILAGIVTVAVMWLVSWALCTSAKANDHVHHPASVKPSSVIDLANWKLTMPGVGMAPTISEPLPPVHVVDVPLICPVCLTPFAYGHLSEFGGLVGGWIDVKRHECVKAASV